MALELPKDVIGFHLRYDFAIESGYVDYRRAPLPNAEIVKLCVSKGWEITPERVAEIKLQRSCYALQRFYRYCVASKTGSPSLMGVSDGKVAQWVPIEGLAVDLLRRVSLAMEVAYAETSCLHPDPKLLKESDWTIGRVAVLHDVERARATVLNFEATNWYLEENRDARIR
ncbi:MAG: hypothetical protein SFV32_07240 [Opitutaceae bacterium]|nr:hypothetical protein [Opitutaceae bacterium]